MRPGFDLDGGSTANAGGAFFLCTETWPRCFVIKQVSDVDGALKEVQQHQQHQKPIINGAEQQPTTSKAATTTTAAEIAAGPSSSSVTAVEEAAAAEASSSSPSPSSSTSPGAANASSPYLPMLPWWFTAECRHQLLAVPGPDEWLMNNRALTPETRPSSSIGGGQLLSEEQLRARLSRQLEYYFSRENLINDRYLRCQMDADQYVPIKIVANFPKVAQLSQDFELIVDVLKSSSQVQVDESGTRVRPMSKRCTIILREIPQSADENEVKSMFQGEGCPAYQSLSYGLNDSWYVTFGSEEDTQQAFFHLQTLGKTFNGKPVFARIKTGGAPIGADLHNRHSPDGHIRLDVGSLRGQLIVYDSLASLMGSMAAAFDRTTPSPATGQPQQNGGSETTATAGAKSTFNLGQILAQFGYVPRATFHPHVSAPAPPVMPPLHPTTNHQGAEHINGLPQPTSFFAQPILHNVGQNELVLRQRAKEQGGVAPSPVLIPSSVPRITDVPRINGKGAPKADSNSQQQPSGGAVTGGRHSPLHNSTAGGGGGGGGGGGFAGFQRQESVEAYQIALAANGVAKQKHRLSRDSEFLEERRAENKADISKATDTVGRAGKCGLKSGGSRTNSSDQAPPRILGAAGHRRSEPPAGPNLHHNHQPPAALLRPLNESSSTASASANWRQPPPQNQQQKQQSPPVQQGTAAATMDFRGVVHHQWQNGPPPPVPSHHLQQQHQQGAPPPPPPVMMRAQPLLSLGQALNSLNQQQQAQHQHPQQLTPLSAGPPPGRGQNFDGRRPRESPFRGGGAGNGPGYRARTWTSDWPRGSQQGQQQPQQSGGVHFAPAQREAIRGGGSFGGGGGGGAHWQTRGGGGGGPGRGAPRAKRSYDAGVGHEQLPEAEQNGQQQLQQQQEGGQQRENRPMITGNHHQHQQQQRPPHFASAHQAQQPPHQQQHGHGGHLPRHEQQQQQPRSPNQQNQHNHHPPPSSAAHHHAQSHQHGSQRCREHSGSSGQQSLAGKQSKSAAAAEPPAAGYNFEEHVEEFPALSLSQSNSRKASECHGDPQTLNSPNGAIPGGVVSLLLAVPEPSSDKSCSSSVNSAVSSAVVGTNEQQTAGKVPPPTPFSAVVASGRPRRATIGTMANVVGSETAKATTRKLDGSGGKTDEMEEKVTERKQPRSGTIGGGTPSTNEALGSHRSYAQMLKGGNAGGTAKLSPGAHGFTKTAEASGGCSSVGTEV